MGKEAELGEEREWSGERYRKTPNGWVLVSKKSGVGNKEGEKTNHISFENKDKYYLESYFSNYDDVLSELSKDQHSALSYYKDENYFSLNQSLRKGNTRDKSIIKNIDSSFDKSQLKHDIELKRVVGGEVLKFFDNLKEGDIYSDKAYVSTTISSDTVKKFSSNNSVELIIKAKRGRKAIPMHNIGDENVKKIYDDEYEFLLPRDSKFKILSKKGNRIEVELIE